MLLLLALAAAASPTPDAAVSAALATPGARAEVVVIRVVGGCVAERFEAAAAVEASGEVALRTAGRDRDGAACTGAAWASVRVFAPALVVTRALREGEPLAGAVAPGEREVRAGHASLAELPEGASAARPLRARQPLAPDDVRVGPRPGEPVAVLVRSGALELERAGRAAPCGRHAAARLGHACAYLPGGRRVEGRLDDVGRILVEAL